MALGSFLIQKQLGFSDRELDEESVFSVLYRASRVPDR